ncbi:tRNA (adenine(58)-N(1))-methyltransferase catalytic subunit trm61 like protein [Verticillium longisporum]|uniref:tRNA (Adenine(58)-N(1))-methyltransferase catalytic subunit trm61 like protein n=1 Tax=Verticillium longisporum TaxID=100787 RepID=A0A8I3AX22_VERLO|nr:tRNA (adenine(58)-N(1))-methyltransferase catalytic subunit trm61 like protein [Verticillium longisporum]
MARPSVFLEPGPKTTAGSLAIIQLSRDNLIPLIPLILEDSTTERDGYAEGATLNTRFGSFPHSTLIGVSWGSQIRASTVDTGSRGRKRKRNEGEEEDSKGSTPNAADDFDAPTVLAPAKKAVTANSGFVHILQPTPELWTQSLPHRTQVVYTPDYSYVLSRIRAQPGTRLIEAGAGSGSFTHASVRAVYNGYPSTSSEPRGKVFSYEFNRGRYEKMHEEIASHHLTGLVELTHRDAYAGGFLVDGASPNASAVFLDLPAPWDALPHLSRARPTAPEYADRFPSADDDDDAAAAGPWVSPLDPAKAAHLCTFSPCIEQVQRTISAMRRLGWIDIDMVEMAHRKINVLRERFPSTNPPERKAPPEPNNVGEAVARLRDIERRAREYDPHKSKAANDAIAAANAAAASPMDVDAEGPAANADETAAKPWLQGRLVHRSEAELKMHTSYLVFATLPREWTDADEAAVLARWPCGSETAVVGSVDKATRKREKREMLAKKKQKRQGARPEGAEAPAVDQVGTDVV